MPDTNTRLRHFGKFLLGAFAAVAVLWVLSLVNKLQSWGLGERFFVCSFIAYTPLATATAAILRKHTTSGIKPAWPIKTFDFRLFAYALVWLIYLSFFGRIGYGDIPSSLGGGKPPEAKLLSNISNRNLLEVAGLPTIEDNGVLISGPVYIVAETDKHLIVHLRNYFDAISIKRDIFTVVKYSGGYRERVRQHKH